MPVSLLYEFIYLSFCIYFYNCSSFKYYLHTYVFCWNGNTKKLSKTTSNKVRDSTKTHIKYSNREITMFFSIIYFYTGEFKLHIKKLLHINNICKQLNSADFSFTAHAVCLLNVLTYLRLCLTYVLNIFLINLNLLSFY